MATNNIGVGQTYSTLAAWEADAPEILTEPWIGVIANPTDIFTGSSTMLEIAGSESTSSFYKELTVADGASFVDNIDPENDPLRYDESYGAAISSNNDSETVLVLESHAKISRIQIRNNYNSIYYGARTINITGGTNIVAKQLLLEATYNGIPLGISGDNTIVSSIAIQRSSGANEISACHSGAKMINVTLVVPSDVTRATYGVNSSVYSAPILKNVAIFGADTFFSGTEPICTSCATDADSDVPSGCVEIEYDTTTGSGFYNTTNSLYDFRLKDTSAMVDAGTFDSLADKDISGRNFTMSHTDIGAWKMFSEVEGSLLMMLPSGTGGFINLQGYFQG